MNRIAMNTTQLDLSLDKVVGWSPHQVLWRERDLVIPEYELKGFSEDGYLERAESPMLSQC